MVSVDGARLVVIVVSGEDRVDDELSASCRAVRVRRCARVALIVLVVGLRVLVIGFVVVTVRRRVRPHSADTDGTRRVWRLRYPLVCSP